MTALHICPAGGPHDYQFVSAADQEDDSGRRFRDAVYCQECGAKPALCALCDEPEGDTEWSKFVPFRGTIAHAGCDLDIDSDMADDYLLRSVR